MYISGLGVLGYLWMFVGQMGMEMRVSLRFDGDIRDDLVVDGKRGLLERSGWVVLGLLVDNLWVRRAFEGSDGVVDDERTNDDSADYAHHLPKFVFPTHLIYPNIIISSEKQKSIVGK